MNQKTFKQHPLTFALTLFALVQFTPATAVAYDFDSGNAAVEVVITTVAPVVTSDVSPSGGDATLVLRLTTMITNAWYDSTAAYHPTAVGVYTRLGRRPPIESTSNANINIALIYGSYRVLNSMLPNRAQTWRDMLTNIGLDPDDDSTDLTTPIGLGNVAGMGVVNGRINDGMNQLGNADGRDYNFTPFADYTGYEPVNTAYDVKNASRWQPDLQRQGIGLYKIQQFVTPQYALTEPYSYPDPQVFGVAKPESSNHRRKSAYKAQADEVLQESANLNDIRKLKSEVFDDKIASLGFSGVFSGLSRGLPLLEFIQLDFLVNMAAHDAGIVIWQEKRQYDAVRPFTAIRRIYGDDTVTAWGGPGQGTVNDITGNEWRSYLEEADHPEYPSASACFCNAHAQAARRYNGDDVLGFEVFLPAGSSSVEPGVTPAVDTTLVWPTWTEFASDCGQSRIWAGVHFRAAVEASEQLCNVFGDMAHDYVATLVDGSAPVRGPSVGLPLDTGNGNGNGNGNGKGKGNR